MHLYIPGADYKGRNLHGYSFAHYRLPTVFWIEPSLFIYFYLLAMIADSVPYGTCVELV